MLNPPKTDALDEKYAKNALRILVGPRDADWHDAASKLLDQGPDFGWEKGPDGYNKDPQDVFEVAGRILGYYCGLIEWKPED